MAKGKWLQAITRRKVFQPDQLDTGNLRRCLDRWDLTALGLSSTLGVGIYYLVGSVALDIAGPSVVLSFFIAAVASLLAGLCYAEFASRVPRAGSAYIYTYVTVGELMAFIIGWNMVLEALFGAASVARGLSIYVDLIAGKTMLPWFESFAPLPWTLLAPYFDFFAFGIVIVIGVLLAIGVRESATVNNVFAALNMAVILFIVVAGSFTANPENWSIPASSVPPNFGVGGFFPFGVWGTLRGAAVCFYGFVGFDSINASSEEVESPRRTIPQAILITLLIVFLSYASVSIVVTMMVPYYLHDTVASVATAFTYVGWDWGRWVVLIGALFGISASLFGSLFPLPRLLYAMASDGLFFHWFARISEGRKSPVIGTLFPSFVIALLAGLLGLEQLVLMMCVGTLLSYTIVASCIIILRYRSNKAATESKGYVKEMFGCGKHEATKSTSRRVCIVLIIYVLMCLIAAVVTVHMDNSMIPSILLHLIVLFLLMFLMLQPQAENAAPFMTPLVPVIPCLSIYINICLMVMINVQTWIRVSVWLLIGLLVYLICVCCYKWHTDKADNTHAHKNGKPPVQIVIESPTPPDTIPRISSKGGEKETTEKEMSEIQPTSPVELKERVVRKVIQEEIIVQQAAVIENNNEEKEANIIDLLDQVLQAEEDTYSTKESDHYGELMEKDDVIVSTSSECIPHRKSLSELSDAGSDASLGNQVLSKYDVIAQVHREDLPKVNEEDDQNDQVHNEEYELEQVTAFNDSETNSQTDESGYSDTIDRTALNESVEEIKENVPYIPEPPPFDENYFKSPNFKKSYTIDISRPSKLKLVDQEEEKPRESIKSNSSQDDATIVFGSDRQVHFMSKLTQIYQSKIADQEEEQTIKPGRRSNSTGNVVENTEYDMANRERPSLFLEMKKELLARDPSSLRPVNRDEKEAEEPEDEKESSMSRDDLKSKLENIFANGGPMLIKPRLMKSNPPTPEESYHTDTSSTESIASPARMPKIEKNDTLGRQKAKFGAVLNSFRLSLNKDDEV